MNLKENTLWRHHNGNIYGILHIANTLSTRPEEYPVTVVYMNVNNGSIWTRKASDWSRSFEEI